MVHGVRFGLHTATTLKLCGSYLVWLPVHKTWRVRVESNHRLMVLQTIALALGHALMVGYPGFEPGKMTRSLGPPLCLISPVAHKTKAPISRGSSNSGLLKHHVYMPRSRNGEPALSNDERQ